MKIYKKLLMYLFKPTDYIIKHIKILIELEELLIVEDSSSSCFNSILLILEKEMNVL